MTRGLVNGCRAYFTGNQSYLLIGNSHKLRLDNRSWMTGDCHVQFSESARVKFSRATQLNEMVYFPLLKNINSAMIKDRKKRSSDITFGKNI
jgi:hypothetical protein